MSSRRNPTFHFKKLFSDLQLNNIITAFDIRLSYKLKFIIFLLFQGTYRQCYAALHKSNKNPFNHFIGKYEFFFDFKHCHRIYIIPNVMRKFHMKWNALIQLN